MNKKEIVLGIDIGGTNTVFGYVDELGNCISRYSIHTNADKSIDDFLDRLNKEITCSYNQLAKEYWLKGIGIGAPLANYYKSTIENPLNLKWGTVNVAQKLKQYYELPIAVTNDANAAAIGEMKFGAAKGMRDFIIITLGTGLGSGIVANGELIYGADGFAGEIGHSIYERNGRICGCGRKGCLETYASATGIRKTVVEMLEASTQASVLRNFKNGRLTSEVIYKAALNGDKVALEAFEFTGKVLGTKLADSVVYTSPEAIFLFGGLADAGKLIFEPTKRYMEENLLYIFKDKVKILPSALPGSSAAVLGAGALIWSELNKFENQLSLR